jgi:predicted acyl esterase
VNVNDAIFSAGETSRRKYEIIAETDVAVTMSDGVKICLDIYRPAGRGHFPALLGMATFNKEIQGDHIWPAPTRSRRIRGVPDASLEVANTDFFVKRGYVNIVGAVRGTGKSGGVYQYLSAREIQDTYEVIEWAARQPWCNGNVGMVGLGYYAAHQPLVAQMQPPHLKAMAPIGTFWDNYRHFWWPGGVLQKGFLRWLISMTNLDVHHEKSVLLEELGEKGYREVIARALADKDINAAPEIMEALKYPGQVGNVNYVDMILHPLMSRYWLDRGSDLDFKKIKVPAYFGAAGHRPSVLYYWPDFIMPKKLIQFPSIYLDRPFYQLTWELLRWFDYWLKGMETGIMKEPPIRIFINGTGEWLTADDFPVPGTRWIPFNLHENQSLCEIEPWPEGASLSYDDSPRNRGRLKYCSAPMVENMDVVGPLILNLYASCRGTEMILNASVHDVDPEGKETDLSQGWLRGTHRELDVKKSKPWLPVHTHTNPQPLVPGQVYEFQMDIWPVARLFKAGHRIMLKIGSSDDVPENLYQVGHEHLISQTPNTVTIYHDARHPSNLLVPVTRGNIIGTYVSGGDISLKSAEFMKLK